MMSRTERTIPEPPRPTAWGWIAPLTLLLAPFAVYWNSLGVPFFFDDPTAIAENPTIRDLSAWRDVLSPPNNGSGAAGRPVINLSLAINYALGGLSPTGYHVANILFHALGTLTLFGLLRRTLLTPVLRDRYGADATALAFFGALLWAVHPLQTESVTCVIQRTELLLGLFYLLALYGFVRGATEASKLWTGLGVGACLVGMATKEVMVSAPLMVLLYDRTFLAGTFAGAWRTRRRTHLVFAACLVLLAFLVLRSGGTRGEAAGFGIGMAWWTYALKQCEAIWLYLRLSFWPHPLVVYYGVDVIHHPLEVWPQILGLVALVAGAGVALVRAPVPGFVAFWFFAILAPSSSVIPLVSQTVSEHRMYLPLLAPVLLALVAGHRLAGRRSFAVFAAVALAGGAVSIRRNADYRSDLVIWNDTVAKAPRNARAHVNLGSALQATGAVDAALAHYQTAAKLDPTSAEALNNIGTILLDRGRPAEAVGYCEAALRLRPNFYLAHNNLGSAFIRIGRLDEGVRHLQRAIELNPRFAEPHCNLASAYTQLKQPAAAITHGRRAIELKPTLALSYFFLGGAYLQAGQPEAALAAYENAVRLNPGDAQSHSNLGSVLYQAGRAPDAIPHFETAVKLLPDYPDAHNNLASALFQTGRAEESIAHYRTAIRLQPDNLGARLNLGLVLTRLGRLPEAAAAYEDVLRVAPDNAAAKTALQQLRGGR